MYYITFNKNIDQVKIVLIITSFVYLIIGLLIIFLMKSILSMILINEYLDHIIVFQIIIMVWFFNALYKNISYVFLTKINNINKPNLIAIQIGLMHILLLLIWMFFSNNYNSLTVVSYMFAGCFLQTLLILVYIGYKKK